MAGQASTALALGLMLGLHHPPGFSCSVPKSNSDLTRVSLGLGQGRERGGKAEAEGAQGLPSHQNSASPHVTRSPNGSPTVSYRTRDHCLTEPPLLGSLWCPSRRTLSDASTLTHTPYVFRKVGSLCTCHSPQGSWPPVYSTLPIPGHHRPAGTCPCPRLPAYPLPASPRPPPPPPGHAANSGQSYLLRAGGSALGQPP